MPASRTPNEAQQPLRIAPNLHLEHTKLTPTGPSAEKAGEPGGSQPAARRDAYGNRISTAPTAAPPRYEPQARRRRRKPAPAKKAGFRPSRTMWLAVLAVVALLLSLAL